MKDIPLFTTQYGAAGLILKEIPYRKEAYIRIHSSLDPEKLLEECRGFCRACGAEKIYAAGHESLSALPLHTAVLELAGTVSWEAEKLAQLFPVTEQTVGQWRSLCNGAMAQVPNAGTLEARDEAEILSSGGAYFVHKEGKLLGLGWLRGMRLEILVSVVPGMGETVLRTLASLTEHGELRIQVAQANEKAMRLYSRIGFLPVAEISRWFRVL